MLTVAHSSKFKGAEKNGENFLSTLIPSYLLLFPGGNECCQTHSVPRQCVLCVCVCVCMYMCVYFFFSSFSFIRSTMLYNLCFLHFLETTSYHSIKNYFLFYDCIVFQNICI